MVKNLSTMPDGAAKISQYLEQEARQFVEACKLGGLVTAGAGIGLLVFLRFYDPVEPVYLAGLIPILVGAALLIYARIAPSRRKPSDQNAT